MGSQPSEHLCLKLKPTLIALSEALIYAQDTNSSQWDFAIPIEEIRSQGFTDTDLRWLVRKGYVDHRREVTVEGDNGRSFRPTGDLTFSTRTCFILTDAGLEKARLLADGDPTNGDAVSPLNQNGHATRHYLDLGSNSSNGVSPCWNAHTRELRLNGTIIKRFKWRAANQETVLSAFQEDGWPPVIDDPLPPKPEQDPRRRLHDTIKALNRNQTPDAIRFHGNGTGEGIRWERLDSF